MTELALNDNLNELKELNEYCKALGLCVRCQLRYLGELYSSITFSSCPSEVESVSCIEFFIHFLSSSIFLIFTHLILFNPFSTNK